MSRFPFSDVPGKPGTLPFIELTLYYVGDDPNLANRLTVPAVVDSGATVNVLPRDVGEHFGLNWKEQQDILATGGIVYGHTSLALLLWGKVPGLKPQKLSFAWSELPSSKVRTLLGQTNFFDEFFVDFRKPLGFFDIEPKR